MIKTIVVEDEWYNLNEICDLVEETGFMSVEGRYQNPVKALEEVSGIYPEVAFIDIEMPEIDGLTLAERLLEVQPDISIVFITAFSQYAINAFDLNALDYLVKPIRTDRFNKMAERIRNEIGLKSSIKSAVLKIKCFGSLEVSINDVPVRWERAKAEELFAYLLMNHGAYIHKDIILENLWQGYDQSKALQILQTSVHKIRSLFSQVKNDIALDYSANKYCLYLKHASCDLLDIEKAISNYSAGDKSTYGSIKEVCPLLKRGFLTREGYLWSIEKDMELKSRVIGILKEITSKYYPEKKYNEISKLLKLVTLLSPEDEEANYGLLLTYEKLHDLTELFNHYLWLEKVLKEDYDTAPSQRIREIFIRCK